MRNDNEDGGGDPPKCLSGTFALTFDGQTTRQLPHDATAELMEEALEELCTLSMATDDGNRISVTRHLHCTDNESQSCMNPEGYTWVVTFESPGDRQLSLFLYAWVRSTLASAQG